MELYLCFSTHWHDAEAHGHFYLFFGSAVSQYTSLLSQNYAKHCKILRSQSGAADSNTMIYVFGLVEPPTH